ncbi:uncharacterized protein LOC132270848 [Cornus florida]|uniref:uncharacterized protein LOC132270848 n=1 Tax=Cornus florida TaxID=4283 RepID=UPI00289F469A|nr:uncharacterized protein LOC132270848 [Cornus florida]
MSFSNATRVKGSPTSSGGGFGAARGSGELDSLSTSDDDHNFTPQTSTIPDIKIEVLVEKKKNLVVFVESNKDFVDLLFSFLTLSVGTIVNLLHDKSPPTVIGCMNNLYKSVENLDARFLSTEACKDMLLQLRRLSEFQCSNLKQMIVGDLNPIKCYYICGNSNCRKEGKGILSDFGNVRCHCGEVMDQLVTLSEHTTEASCDEGEGEFLKGGTERFLVSDGLQIMSGSIPPSIMLLKKLGIVDANELESRSLNIGPEEIMQLLRLSLLTKAPLTHWISLVKGASDPIEIETRNMAKSLGKRSATSDPKKMSLTIFISKSRNKVLYAECGEDFVDFLFSFLTFPLGSILKLLGGKSSLGSFDSLYKNVNDLSTENYFKSEELKNMLLSPKLAPFFACENQLLHIEESSSPQYLLYTCGATDGELFVHPMTSKFDGFCFGQELGLWSMVNPKSSTGQTTGGGGFVKGPAKFMVTDDLVVTPLSPISSISFLGKLDVPITDVDQKVVTVGEEEALNLLKAALISETALTDVFTSRDQSAEDVKCSFGNAV